MKQFVRANMKIWLGLFTVLFLSQMGTAHAHVHLRHHSAHRSIHGVDVRNFNDRRPSAWCGWYMRKQVSNDPGPDYNLARQWLHFGTPAAGPFSGVIVVWPHHVGKITGYDNSKHQWIVLSGNDSHQVKNRPRSLAGALGYRNP